MYKIRCAIEKDVDIIWNLGNNVKEFETTSGVITFWPKEILKECINKDDVLVLVAEESDKIIGFIIININLSLKKADIENIYVLDSYRQQGIGSKLIKSAIERIKQKGIENICHLTSDNYYFWEKNGFIRGNNFCWMDLILTNRFKK